jgi:hypothetical protein
MSRIVSTEVDYEIWKHAFKEARNHAESELWSKLDLKLTDPITIFVDQIKSAIDEERDNVRFKRES